MGMVPKAGGYKGQSHSFGNNHIVFGIRNRPFLFGSHCLREFRKRRSLSEALYCHGEGVSVVSLGSSCHFHASHHCINPWPWRSPLRPKELWSGKVRQDTTLQTLHVLTLSATKKVLHSRYYSNKVVCRLQQLKAKEGGPKCPGCYLIYPSHPF
ncbi:hypothetical protein AAG906_012911 [Vitis piasezkii]